MDAVCIILIGLLLIAGFCTGMIFSVWILYLSKKKQGKNISEKDHAAQRPSYPFGRKPQESGAESPAANGGEKAGKRLEKVASNPSRTYLSCVTEEEDADRKFAQKFRHRQNESYNYTKKKQK